MARRQKSRACLSLVSVRGCAAPPSRGRVPRQNDFSEYLESLLVTVILALFGTSFVVQAFKIPSASMETTLLIGDHLLVNKFIFGGTDAWYEKILPYRAIKRGDIIVFKYPFLDHPHYVKRVIGLPGDHLKLVDQQVYINGQALDEPYVVHDPAVPYDPFNYSFPPLRDQMIPLNVINEWRPELRKYVQGDEMVVPPGKVFRDGRQSRSQPGQPLLGLRGPRRHHGPSVLDLLVGGYHVRGRHHLLAAAGGYLRHAHAPSGTHPLEKNVSHRTLRHTAHWQACVRAPFVCLSLRNFRAR